MFNNEMTQIKRAQFLVISALAAGAVALSLSAIKSYVQNRWVTQRENVACVPSNVDFSHPMVYRQSFVHPVNADARIKTFVEQYVHLTQDESIVNYHSITTAARYDRTKLSKSKWQAIEMSTGLEKMNLMKAYGDSSDMYRLMADSGVGWKFLIDDIVIYGIPKSGPILAIARGQYQVTYDQAKRPDVPHKLFGYKEIRMTIVQGAPTKDAEGNFLNKTGLFVNFVSEDDASPERKESLTKQPSDIYLKSEPGE